MMLSRRKNNTKWLYYNIMYCFTLSFLKHVGCSPPFKLAEKATWKWLLNYISQIYRTMLPLIWNYMLVGYLYDQICTEFIYLQPQLPVQINQNQNMYLSKHLNVEILYIPLWNIGTWFVVDSIFIQTSCLNKIMWRICWQPTHSFGRIIVQEMMKWSETVWNFKAEGKIEFV